MVSKAMTAPADDRRSVSLGSGIIGFFRGVTAVLAGSKRLLTDAQLRKNALVPLLITLFAYLAAFGAFAFYADDLIATLWQRPDDWKVYLWYALVPVVLVFFVLILALVFVTIATSISGPFYEKMVSQLLQQKDISTQSIGFWKGLYSEIVRSLFFIVPAIGLAVLGIIPYVGAPFALVGIFIGWLGLASTSVNPALIMTGYGTKAQIAFVFRSLSVMLGAGAVIGLSLTIPLLGLLIIPCSFVGLTELYADTLKKTQHP